jgi:hypothetical protein
MLPRAERVGAEYSNFDVKKGEWKGFLESGEKKIQTCSNKDCAQMRRLRAIKRCGAAYVMDQEVVRRDQLDPQAPLDSRSREIASNRLRSRRWVRSSRQKRTKAGRGRRLGAGKAAKAPEARPVGESLGQRHVGKIVPGGKQERLEHRQGRPGLLAYWRRLEPRQNLIRIRPID